MLSWFKTRRRSKIQAHPWPEAWSGYLRENVRHCHRLDVAHFDRLLARIKVILTEKHWETAEGLQLTDEIRVTIAGQASLMLLGVEDFYFDNVPSIIVFPDSFGRDFQTGTVTERRQHAGEAWQGGPIILSWQDVLAGGSNATDGRNLVFHEFAHALDGIDGEMGGNVMFDDQATTDRWLQVSQREFESLCGAAERGQRTLLDHYGATNKAEFFAVAIEAFFERPGDVKRIHSDLYALLVTYFRLDPISWQAAIISS